jgi:hypothetical protein
MVTGKTILADGENQAEGGCAGSASGCRPAGDQPDSQCPGRAGSDRDQKMADLAQDGVQFKVCNNAMKAAGFNAEDMHGFITVVPAGFPELAYWQKNGYQYINPLPLPLW